jgi:unsaturated rhamnogalacturonyl hydrolase
MYKTSKIICIFILQGLLFLACPGINAQNIPSKQTMESMILANKYFIGKHPDVSKTKISNWTRSVYFEGLMELYKVNPDTAFSNRILKWAQYNLWGLPLGTSSRNTENQSIGQIYIDLYMMNRYKEERIRNIRTCIDNMLATEKTDDWTRLEDLMIAMPVYARLGKIYDNEKYFDGMNKMYLNLKQKEGTNGLYNPTDNLWWYNKDFVAPYKEPNGENCYWSRGNGLVVAALVRTLEFLPKKNKYEEEYTETLTAMIEALVPLQRTDGFWNVSLKDPGNFGGKEVTGSALFVYGIAWAINQDIISKKEYLPVVMKAWNAIIKEALHTDGFIGYVQGEGTGPKDSQPVAYDTDSGYDDLGLGCFLLAGSEVFKLSKSIEPKEKEPKKEKDNKGEKSDKGEKGEKGDKGEK